MGQSYDEAAAALFAAGLANERVDVPGTGEPGTVVGTDPPAGSRLDRGATVRLEVAAAAPTTTTTTAEPEPEREDRGKRDKDERDED